MTGLQDHPGTGRTLMKKPTYLAYPEHFAQASGIKNVRVIDPQDLDQTIRVLKEETKRNAASLIISRRSCVFVEKPKRNSWVILFNLCNQCGKCLKVGCPALYRERAKQKRMVIDEVLCTGCGFCAQVCPQNAIVPQ